MDRARRSAVAKVLWIKPAAPEGGDGFMDRARVRAFISPVSPARSYTPST